VSSTAGIRHHRLALAAVKVLIVSSSDATHRWVRGALGPDASYREVPHGIDAVRRAQTGGFDLVIADETSIPYGAFGLSRDLKLLPEPPAVIILLERDQDTWLAKWSGADRWFLRPVDVFELARAAAELVAARAGSESPPEEPVTDPTVSEPVVG